MTHHAPSGIALSRLAQSEENNCWTENIFCLRVNDAEQLGLLRSLFDEGASSTTASFAGCRQVFGLTGNSHGRAFLLTSASQPTSASACIEAFVPVYRCGTVLDFHQIPYFYAEITRQTNSTRERNILAGSPLGGFTSSQVKAAWLRVLNVAYPLLPVSAGSAGGAEQILYLLDRGLVERGIDGL